MSGRASPSWARPWAPATPAAACCQTFLERGRLHRLPTRASLWSAPQAGADQRPHCRPAGDTLQLLDLLRVRRVGRVLVRKLLLRGYAVSALVRSLEGHNLPQSVKLVQGDVSNYASCRAALEGIDKVPASHTGSHKLGMSLLRRRGQAIQL